MSSVTNHFVSISCINSLCLVYDTVKLHVNKMDVSFPTQLYIDGTFVNGTSGRKLQSLDPKNESLICEVECASREDVDRACKAAHRAFTVRTINYKYIYLVCFYSVKIRMVNGERLMPGIEELCLQGWRTLWRSIRRSSPPSRASTRALCTPLPSKPTLG